jgi:hypothetical protein
VSTSSPLSLDTASMGSSPCIDVYGTTKHEPAVIGVTGRTDHVAVVVTVPVLINGNSDISTSLCLC